MNKFDNFKPKTDFERNIVLRGVIRVLRKNRADNLSLIEGLLDNINTLKLKIKEYGKNIHILNTKINEERAKNKILSTQLRQKNSEIYKLITDKYTKNGKN